MQAGERVGVWIVISAPAPSPQHAHGQSRDGDEHQQYPNENKRVDHQVANVVVAQLLHLVLNQGGELPEVLADLIELINALATATG